MFKIKPFTLKWFECDFFVIDVVVVNIMYRSLFSGSPFYRHLALPLGYGMNEVTFQWKSIKGELKGRKYEKLKTKAFLTVYRYSISWNHFGIILGHWLWFCQAYSKHKCEKAIFHSLITWPLLFQHNHLDHKSSACPSLSFPYQKISKNNQYNKMLRLSGVLW